MHSPAEKKKVEEKKSVKSKSSASTSQPAAVSTDQRFEELDQKWSDRFNPARSTLFRLWTSLSRNRLLAQSRWSQLTLHQLMSSGRSLSSNQPTSQFLSQLTNLLCLLTNLKCLQLPTHRLLSFSLTGLWPWTNQQPLIGLPLVSLVPSNRPEGTSPVSRTQTVLYQTNPCGYYCGV